MLTPNVRDAFHLTNAGILLIVAIAGAAALLCTLPVAVLADRTNRVRIALIGALVGAAFSIGLGAAQTVVVATIMLVGVSMGQAVIFPTHNSLLADYYPVPARPRIYSAHRAGISIGAIAGVLIGAGLAAVCSWRAPFFFFAVPIVIVVLIGLRLREPPRGRHEQVELSRADAGLRARRAGPPGRRPRTARRGRLDVPVEPPPSLGEAWRTVWKIGALRRIFVALPFLAAAIAGFTSLASLQYQETFHLDAVQRAYLIAPIQVFDLLGLAVGAVIATRLARARHRPRLPHARRCLGHRGRLRRPLRAGPERPRGLHRQRRHRRVAGRGRTGRPRLPLARHPVAGPLGRVLHRGALRPAGTPRAPDRRRARRRRRLPLRPPHAGPHLHHRRAHRGERRQPHRARRAQRVDLHAHAGPDAGAIAPRGTLPLLAVRELRVGYDGVPVLPDVDDRGRRGRDRRPASAPTAPASRRCCGRSAASSRPITAPSSSTDATSPTCRPTRSPGSASPRCPAARESSPTCAWRTTCAAAAWQGRRRGERDADMIDEALAIFPTLAARRSERAANLSGGQQQMLALAMATITRPKLFLIDELSLGLSPIVVEQLLGAIESMRRAGTAILLVEQSMNVAVAVADRVYVMETGAVRFSGTAAELAAHPELLWSIYLEKASETLEAHGRPRADRSATAHPELEVRGLSLSFGGNAALDDVSLQAAHGEIVGIIGPNGAGQDDALRRHLGFPPAASRDGSSWAGST